MANEKRLDLINKWDVVNKLIQLENNYQFYKGQWDADVLYRRICELEIGIGKTPTVDAVEVVHARWINKTKEIHGMVDERNDCSNCGQVYWFACPDFNYCPNCGAKMDGGKDDVH
jgi:hypothetical protein